VAHYEYFAAARPEDIGDELSKKVDSYYSYLTSASIVNLWRRSYYAYYGLLSDSSLTGFGLFAVGTIRAGGLLGEIASIKVNHLRNLLQHILVMTTQDRPALKCRSINSDSQNLSNAYLGDGIIDYYMRYAGIEKKYRDAVELALIFGEAHILIDWDEHLGEDYLAVPGQRPIKTGDLYCKIYNPFDVLRDTTSTNNEHNWWIVHDVSNRYDLAARYPHAANELLTISTDHESPRRFIDPTKIIPAAGIGTKESDLVDNYTFYHARTDAMPLGRKTKLLQGGTILSDEPLRTKKVPMMRIATSNIQGTTFGYTVAFDLLGIQETIDKLTSSVVTNQLSNGIQNFWQPMGNQLTTIEIAGGLNLMESAVKPEVLQLCATPAELFKFIPDLITTMETLTSVGAVNRGEAPENLKSGTALAFMATTAISFNSGLQNSYNECLEEGANTAIQILRDRLPTDKTIAIAGKFERPMTKTFNAKSLQGIEGIYCEIESPMMRTMAGKIQIAQDMLQNGLIANKQEYLTFINTGSDDPLYERDMTQAMCIKSENEDMQDGKPVLAIMSDNHPQHILEHMSLLDSSDARRNAQLVQAVIAHCEQHEAMEWQLQTSNPMLLAIYGRQPLPPPFAPPPAPQLGPGQQPPPQAPAQGATQHAHHGGPPAPGAQTAGIMNPANKNPAQAKLPGLPKTASSEAQNSYQDLKGGLNQ
jgi:hypothetical protein